VQQRRRWARCNDDFRLRFQYYFDYIKSLLHDWRGSASIYASLQADHPDAIIYSDASGEVGYGALEVKTRKFMKGVWTDKEMSSAQRLHSTSSTHLEILAMVKAIRTFARPYQSIRIFADSAAAVFILQKRYDRNSDISQGIIIAIDRFCRDHGISLFFTHVLRSHDHIQIVDALSKGSIPECIQDWEEVKAISMTPIQF